MGTATTALGKLLEEYATGQPADPSRFLTFVGQARGLCDSGLGTIFELFYCEILVFSSDVLEVEARHSLQLRDAVEALKLSAFAMMEFSVAFPKGPSHSNACLKAFAFFGIITTTIEALDKLVKRSGIIYSIDKLKKSVLWDTRNNFAHVHRESTPIKFPELRLHEFRAEHFHSDGFRYFSRSDSMDGFASRPFSYEREISSIVMECRNIFGLCRQALQQA